MTPYYADEAVRACACGCGGCPSPGRRFITRHNLHAMGPRTDRHKASLAEAARRAWATKRKRKPLGSRRLDANGYWLIKVREGNWRWDKEHVLVVERAIGRRLVPGEQVHHINGVKTDNSPMNLQLCKDNAEHMHIEGTYRRLLPALLASGVVIYDRAAKEYRIA